MYFEMFEAMAAGELERSTALAARLQERGAWWGDPNLVALGLVGEGRALIKDGRVAEGLGALDEAMLAALAERLHPVWTGAVYCHLMDACRELGELSRHRRDRPHTGGR